MSSFYGEQQRVLQDQFDGRGIADVLEAVIVQPEINDESAAFIESRTFFFLSTVNAHGHPTVSHKGGAAGFVQVVDRTTIVFPSYDGNGMFLSMGNIVGDGRIGLLFMDFERPHRIRAHAHATVSPRRSDDRPLPRRRPRRSRRRQRGLRQLSPLHHPAHARRRVEVRARRQRRRPAARMKKIDALQPFLPTRFQGIAEAENDLITMDEYERRLADGEG